MASLAVKNVQHYCDEQFDSEIRVYENKLMALDRQGLYVVLKVNFCPYCGAELTCEDEPVIEESYDEQMVENMRKNFVAPVMAVKKVAQALGEAVRRHQQAEALDLRTSEDLTEEDLKRYAGKNED